MMKTVHSRIVKTERERFVRSETVEPHVSLTFSNLLARDFVNRQRDSGEGNLARHETLARSIVARNRDADTSPELFLGLASAPFIIQIARARPTDLSLFLPLVCDTAGHNRRCARYTAHGDARDRTHLNAAVLAHAALLYVRATSVTSHDRVRECT